MMGSEKCLRLTRTGGKSETKINVPPMVKPPQVRVGNCAFRMAVMHLPQCRFFTQLSHTALVVGVMVML